jgi:cyclohexa-1,5-dienecarbonyl-CoA hydratase
MSHTIATRYQFIDWQASDGAACLTLRRAPLNVLNIAMLREMAEALDDAAADPSLRVLVVQADRGLRVFSAGVDIADHTAEKVGEMIPLFDQVCAALSEFPAPTLAAVHGHALGGGCEVALCCDLVIAAEGANFGQPEIRLASVAPIAALRLPELIGYRRAAELLFTGKTISAVEAASLGLINRAVAPAELEDAVAGVVEQLRSLSAVALHICKRALRLASQDWSRLAAVEQLYLKDLLSTVDAHEGVAAFMAKRQPNWRHH